MKIGRPVHEIDYSETLEKLHIKLEKRILRTGAQDAEVFTIHEEENRLIITFPQTHEKIVLNFEQEFRGPTSLTYRSEGRPRDNQDIRLWSGAR